MQEHGVECETHDHAVVMTVEEQVNVVELRLVVLGLVLRMLMFGWFFGLEQSWDSLVIERIVCVQAKHVGHLDGSFSKNLFLKVRRFVGVRN